MNIQVEENRLELVMSELVLPGRREEWLKVAGPTSAGVINRHSLNQNIVKICLIKID